MSSQNIVIIGDQPHVTHLINAMGEAGHAFTLVADSAVYALELMPALEEVFEIVKQKDFGKRGKKGKMNKDWHNK